MQTRPATWSHEAISERLRITREAMGLSQKEWCKRCGIATNTWNNYERGISRISLDEALKVVATFGIPLDWIYTGNAAFLPARIAEQLRAHESQHRARDEASN